MEWKEVIGSNGDYLVSDTGCVMSLKNHSKRLLKPRPSVDGYLRYALRMNGKAVEVKAHRLVVIHFIPNTEHKETVNHKDGNKKNNHVENLEWANRNEQMIHAYKLGLKKPMRGILQTRHLLTEDMVKDLRCNYKSHSKDFGAHAFAKKYNVSLPTIYRCVYGRSYQDVE